MLQDEFEMENENYESSTRSFDRRCSIDHSSKTMDESKSSLPEIFKTGVRRRQSKTEIHVYEDIAVVSDLEKFQTDRSIISLPENAANNNNNNNNINGNNNNNKLDDDSKPSKRSKNLQKNCNNSRQSSSSTKSIVPLSSIEREKIGNFRRNLTFPSSPRSEIIFDDANIAKRSYVRSIDAANNEFLRNDDCPSSLHLSPIVSSTIIENPTKKVENLIVENNDRRRRKKKDCKHCRNKANGIIEISSNDRIGDSSMRDDDPILPVAAMSDCTSTFVRNYPIGRRGKMLIAREPILNFPNGVLPIYDRRLTDRKNSSSTREGENYIFFMSNGTNESSIVGSTNNRDIGNNDSESTIVSVEIDDELTLVTTQTNRDDCTRVNSIYSQEQQLQCPNVSIVVTDFKEESRFQRAHSQPTRLQIPSPENRSSLGKSSKTETNSNTARLHENRREWNLDFPRPLDGSERQRSFFILLAVILALLGIGGIALYIVFEPDKFRLILHYFIPSSYPSDSIDSTNDLDGNSIVVESATTETVTTFAPTIETVTTLAPTTETVTTFAPTIETVTTLAPTTETVTTLASTTETVTTLAPTTETVTTLVTSTASFTQNISATNRQTISYSQTIMEQVTTPIIDMSNVNVTRYCDDCYVTEVCVALVADEVPFCRIGPDPLDPTGCAGLCLINKQKCHRLDVDAFRCVKVGHCLDDEWMCSNTLCIHADSYCDGHMDCYDHSDEYNCDCNLLTHFHCGNETSCMPLNKKCDGKIDCWDAFDEINCTVVCPSSDDFMCSNGECILKARFCDGFRDCTDGSDEPNGCQGRCNKYEFSCQNGRCITKSMRCNDIDDCGDKSDEQICTFKM